jgi:hypothetical protein
VTEIAPRAEKLQGVVPLLFEKSEKKKKILKSERKKFKKPLLFFTNCGIISRVV